MNEIENGWHEVTVLWRDHDGDDKITSDKFLGDGETKPFLLTLSQPGVDSAVMYYLAGEGWSDEKPARLTRPSRASRGIDQAAIRPRSVPEKHSSDQANGDGSEAKSRCATGWHSIIERVRG